MRILGIDVGTTSIKAVELESAFGRYEIHEHHEIDVRPDETATEALRRLMLALPKAPDRISMALRAGQATFRNLELPTKDRKAIQAGIAFELEDDLPFPIEDSAYDYSILSQAGQKTRVHVASTLSTHIENALELWKAAEIDPDLVTTEAWAYRVLFNRVLSPQAQEEPVLFVQMGHTRTVFYLHWRGSPIMSREIPWGGRDLTTTISARYSVPVDQAEQTKIDNGFVLPYSQEEQATPEQREFSQAIQEGLSELFRELHQAVLTCKSVTHQTLGAIYVAGGASLLPGLRRLIEEEFGTQTFPLQGLSSITASGVTYSEQSDTEFVLASALALCQVGAERNAAINLRRGRFDKQGKSREINLQALKRPLAALALILVCFTASMIVQGRVYRAKVKQADAQLEKGIRSFFGQISSSGVRNYLSNTPSLRNAIKKELDRERQLRQLLGPNPHSPVAFLKDLSQSIPRDVVVDMTQFQVGSSPADPYAPTGAGTVTVTFLVANPQVAERLAGLLAPKIEGMQRSKMEEVTGPDGGAKRWKITFSGKPSEAAYGE